MNDEDKLKLDEIKLRWKDSMHSVCSDCMYSCIRHWDRNVDVECVNEGKDFKHPDRHDGAMYAEAGSDIKCLIDMVESMKK